ncbi:hypothetical protein OZZ08_07185 [Malaciobacter mytili]|uniref:hypothetical protein n=1 Tax=Malaciobacter mytili TaxID=603050 RepID=UPI003BB0502F
MKQEKLIFETKTYSDLYIYDKLLRVGVISSSKLGTAADLAMYRQHEKEFYIHNFSKEMYLLMKDIVGDKNR